MTHFKITAEAGGRGTIIKDGVDIGEEVDGFTVCCAAGHPTVVTVDFLADVELEVDAEATRSGGGDADDRGASEGSAAPASSPPPSSADHFAPDDEGLTDYGGWFPPADDDDIDGAAELARQAYKGAPWSIDAWPLVVEAVRQHDAARQPSSDWPDDAARQRAMDAWQGFIRNGSSYPSALDAALVAAGPPPFASADVVADMLDERDALRAELEVAKGLIRLVSDSTRALWQGGDGWEWEVHPSYVTPEQARYIESCVGGESE